MKVRALKKHGEDGDLETLKEGQGEFLVYCSHSWVWEHERADDRRGKGS